MEQDKSKLEETNPQNASELNSEPILQETPIETSNSTGLEVPEISFEEMNLDEIISRINEVINKYPVAQLKRVVDAATASFDALYAKEMNALKSFREGGNEEEVESHDVQMKELEQKKHHFDSVIHVYKEKKHEYMHQIEEERNSNLEKKLAIIENLKNLTNREESLNVTFQDFRKLQEEWRNVGPVPSKQMTNILETYHYYEEQFYNYIKLNKELRDMDWKRNQTDKEAICVEAEQLEAMEDKNEAFKQLQFLHDRWKEIGPVSKEMKEELWNRFKVASDHINANNYNFYESLKKEQENNLQLKQDVITKIEQIGNRAYTTAKEWQTASAKIIELQEQWKQIGSVPQKERAKLFKQFRDTCDQFFNKKRDFTHKLDEEQTVNYQKKVKLCEKVEAIKDSTDWKTTTDKIISYQREWKKIGPAPRRYSNKVWNRFRAACDEFFLKKTEYHKDIDAEQENNYQAKMALIEEVKSMQMSDDNAENITHLKEFQTRWNAIGFVPIKKKMEVVEAFRTAINDHFNQLDIDEFNKDLVRFKAKIDTINTSDNRDFKIIQEREKLTTKIRQLETDIQVYENNIGFISKTNKSENLLSDLNTKIGKARQRLTLLQEKLKELDSII